MKSAIILVYEIAAALILAVSVLLGLTSLQGGVTGNLVDETKAALLVVSFFMIFSGFIFALMAVSLATSPIRWKLRSGVLIAGFMVAFFVFAVVAGEDFSYRDLTIVAVGIPIIALVEFSASRLWRMLTR